MNRKEWYDSLKRKGIEPNRNQYIEIKLGNGRFLQARYDDSSSGDVFLYSSETGHTQIRYKNITSVTLLPVRRRDVSKNLEDTLTKCGEKNTILDLPL